MLATRDARQESGDDVVLDWLHPLHGGEAFDLPGRLLVLPSGLLAAALASNGWWRWMIRRRRATSR